VAKVSPWGFDGTPTCRSRRHHGSPPNVLPGLQICAGCREQLENDLIRLPTWYGQPDHSDFREDRFTEPMTSRRRRRVVRSEMVVTIRSDILSTLASWCEMVVAERGVTEPYQLDVRQLATFLAIHLNWLTEHPAAPDLVDELAALAQTARELILPSIHDQPALPDGTE
jgi:hypothetical protein